MSKTATKKPRKPKALDPCYVYMLKIFEQLDEARAVMRRAYDFTVIKNPAHAIWYRDGLDKVTRLEAQVDALGYVFQKTEEELRRWLDDMLAYYKKLEETA